MRLLRGFAVGVAVLCLVVVQGWSFGGNAVTAQEGASGLQVSPTRHEINVEPGEVKEVSFVLKNITKINIRAKITINDFEADNVTGAPKIIVDKSKTSAYSLRKYVREASDVELKVGESKEVKLTVDVPSGAAPGAYFGVVRFDANPSDGRPSKDRQVALTASVAPLLLLQVNGQIKEQIKVDSISARRGDKASSMFVAAPNKVAITVENLGNSFAKPFGRVAIQDMRGKEFTAYELNNTTPRGNVLPSSSRVFTNDIKEPKLPGRYKIVASVAHGNGGEVINYNASFWYFPVWFLGSLVAVLAAIGAAVFVLIRRQHSVKRKNVR